MILEKHKYIKKAWTFQNPIPPMPFMKHYDFYNIYAIY